GWEQVWPYKKGDPTFRECWWKGHSRFHSGRLIDLLSGDGMLAVLTAAHSRGWQINIWYPEGVDMEPCAEIDGDSWISASLPEAVVRAASAALLAAEAAE